MYDYKLYYERYLPHIQPYGATLFVTFRLVGSVPRAVMDALRDELRTAQRQINTIADNALRQKQHYEEQRRSFGRYDAYLDKASNEPYWLREPAVARCVIEAMHYRDGKVYELIAYCVMANHVHMVFKPLEQVNSDGMVTPYPLQTIMHSLKLYTAKECNKLLERSGQFWQHESYDHYARSSAELQRIVRYTLNNPVKAGLCESWDEWPWSYCKYEP